MRYIKLDVRPLVLTIAMVLVGCSATPDVTTVNEAAKQGEFFAVREAAERGDAEEQFRLGLMYAKGEGMAADYGQAYAWLSVAAANGHDKAAEGRDLVAAQLSPAQLAEGQALATRYFEQSQKH